MTRRGKKNERGASAVEYGLMVAGIAAAIIIPAQGLGLGLGVVLDHCTKEMADPSTYSSCTP